MPTLEEEKIARRALARYLELAERCRHDLKLWHDAALAISLPFIRLQRIKRARREVADELREIEGEKSR